MLWLALRFPRLPLEIFTRGMAISGSLAVVSSSATNAEIVVCNQEARRHGIDTGMPVVMAWALASGLRVFTRDAPAEHAALERAAAWALQFTPTVSIATSTEILLEVEGSLRFFGGLNRLWTEIKRKTGATGYTVNMAGAPTPLAAQLFARAGLPPRIRHGDALRLSLGQLPVSVLELSPALSDLLRDIGIRTLGECLELPRDGLARRAGRELLAQLDRAFGDVPDPRPAFVPPQNFKATLSLPAPVESAEMLLFAARRLIAELCGLLAAIGKGAQRLKFLLLHENGHETRLSLNLVAASRDPAHLTSVLRERLERARLPSPAITMTLESERLQPLSSSNLAFLPDERQQTEALARLIERLRARLGETAVQGLDAVADHRPERAWHACEPGNGDGTWITWRPSARPLWLLNTPRPLTQIRETPQHEGPLTLLTMPERIESGWWDGDDVRRDYFVARDPAESLLWIYREHRANGGWYLHGYFS
ncbi:MAG TPA: DNA polymerase Y family protein [Burkholderiales bacterium]|nr:DNA polymerase Y family protein [Burkholderiales bacterium]